MFGKPHDIDNSFSDEAVTNTRTVESLEIDLENALESVSTLKRLSLQPLVLKYSPELKDLRLKMNLATGVPGTPCLKSIVLWDDEISTLNKFITELLNGANEVL